MNEYRKEVAVRDQGLESKTDEKCGKIRSDVIQEVRRRNDAQADAVRNVSDHIAELAGMVAAQRKNREDTYEVLIKQLGSDVLKLNESINVTRKAREDSHSRVYRLLDELQAKLGREIAVG